MFSSIFPVLNIIAGIGTAALVYFGGLTVRQGGLSAGQWYLFIQGLALFWFPLTSIASFWSQFQLGLAAGERVFALIDAEPRVVQTDNRPARHLRGEIAFEHVDFSYTRRPRTRDRCSLPTSRSTSRPARPWRWSATPAPASRSIGKLIARFYEFQGGRILIDGHDIRTLRPGGLPPSSSAS